MEGREAMSFPGSHSPFYFPRGAFTSISAPQSANALHAPPGFRPILNPNLSNSGHHPFPFGEQQRHQDFTHGIHMGIASSPTIQPPSIPPSPVASQGGQEETEMVVKKKRGRPKKNVPQVSLGLSPMPSSNKPKESSSMSDPNSPQRARGRPRGTGRKQRLANLGEWMNSSAGSAFTPHVISVEAGEDIVSKVLSFSQERPRVLCIMSGTGTVSSVTLCQSSGPSVCFQGNFEILSLGGSYLVNEEGGPKSRTGGISVSLSRLGGYLIGGRVGTLIAASLVQVVACSFVYGNAKAKAINKQEKGSKQDKNKMETPSSEPEGPEPSPASATESATEGEAAHMPPEFSAPPMTRGGWSGSGGGSRSLDSRNNNQHTDIDLTRG